MPSVDLSINGASASLLSPPVHLGSTVTASRCSRVNRMKHSLIHIVTQHLGSTAVCGRVDRRVESQLLIDAASPRPQPSLRSISHSVRQLLPRLGSGWRVHTNSQHHFVHHYYKNHNRTDINITLTFILLFISVQFCYGKTNWRYTVITSAGITWGLWAWVMWVLILDASPICPQGNRLAFVKTVIPVCTSPKKSQ